MPILKNKIQLIEQRLLDCFQPSYLEVKNTSESHRGHAGYHDGDRHFAITIQSKALSENRIIAHRQIYDLFNDLIPDSIHALSIKIK